VAGGVVAPRRSRVRAALGDNSGPLPDVLRDQIRHPSLSTSWRVRTTLLSAVVVEMVIKPDRAIGLIIAFTLMGLVWSIPQWMERSSRGVASGEIARV